MQLLSFLEMAVLASFAITTVAVPVEDTGEVAFNTSRSITEETMIDTGDIMERGEKVPSVDIIKNKMLVGKNRSIFYAGPLGERYRLTAIRATETRSYLSGYEILDEMWRNMEWPKQYEFSSDEKVRTKFLQRASRAMAELTSGTAYVMLPPGKGKKWDKPTAWAKYEYPYLSKNVRLIRINPYNDDQEVLQEGRNIGP